MPELSAKIVAEVVEACRTGAVEAAAALARGLDAQATLSVGPPGSAAADSLPEGTSGPGLVLVFVVDQGGAVLLIPEATGLLPRWCPEPDATGQSKLSTLAQELGMLLLPEQYMPTDFKASYVRSLSGALARGGPAEDAVLLPLDLSVSGEPKGTAALVWPVARPGAVTGAGAGPAKGKPQPKPQPKPVAKTEPPRKPRPDRGPVPAAARPPASPRDLPEYTHSLLHVRVPLVVTLARKKQALGRIVELGPGSIIQFEKSCEEMLELEAGGRSIAQGEAVKVGDKFGLRITSMVLPDERFKPVDPQQAKFSGRAPSAALARSTD